LKQPTKNNRRTAGYSKAIDIWSIGCITTTLLTNELIFERDYDEQDVANRWPHGRPSRKLWDLSILETRGEWQTISRKAKSFVRGCLSLNESERLTAEQAMNHEWFTNKHYAKEIEAVYRRAIADWKPRDHGGSLIEFLNTTKTIEESTRTRDDERMVEDTRSRHFPVQQASQMPYKLVPINNAGPVRFPVKNDHKQFSPIGEGSMLDPIHASPLIHPDSISARPIYVPGSPPAIADTQNQLLDAPNSADMLYPETPLTLHETLPRPPADFSVGLPQSGPMLDDPSQLSIPFPPNTCGSA
jgi:serine/threonine protein kinase